MLRSSSPRHASRLFSAPLHAYTRRLIAAIPRLDAPLALVSPRAPDTPKLVIADEAGSALDVPVRAQVLDLLAGLRRDLGLAPVLISHDLTVIRALCEHIAVMDAGRIGELKATDELFANPEHEVTRAPIATVPTMADAG